MISDAIKKNKYSEVHLYDDSLSNIHAMLNLKKVHPGVKFHGYHVQHGPSGTKITHYRAQEIILPIYEFENTKTGEIFTEMMSIADMEKYVKKNKHIKQTIGNMTLADPVRIGVKIGRAHV